MYTIPMINSTKESYMDDIISINMNPLTCLYELMRPILIHAFYATDKPKCAGMV